MLRSHVLIQNYQNSSTGRYHGFQNCHDTALGLGSWSPMIVGPKSVIISHDVNPQKNRHQQENFLPKSRKYLGKDAV